MLGSNTRLFRLEKRAREKCSPCSPSLSGSAPRLLHLRLPGPQPPLPSHRLPPRALQPPAVTFALPASSFFFLSSSSMASAGKAGGRQRKGRDRKERSVRTEVRPQALRPQEQGRPGAPPARSGTSLRAHWLTVLRRTGRAVTAAAIFVST